MEASNFLLANKYPALLEERPGEIVTCLSGIEKFL